MYATGGIVVKKTVEFINKQTTNFGYDEAIKTLRTNISFCGKNIRAIALTSSNPNEGKSSITFALACSLAEMGKKTLLIDADIRKSVFVSRYQIHSDVLGLSQFLSGQIDLDEVWYHTNVEYLDMIFSGPYSPNPSELLEDPSFDKMLQWARTEYDYILIDTPPIGSVIDAAIVAKTCDGAVMVIESGASSYRIAQRGKQQLEKSGCRILGVVLNKVNRERSGYYGKFGKYGNYRPYYGEKKKHD